MLQILQDNLLKSFQLTWKKCQIKLNKNLNPHAQNLHQKYQIPSKKRKVI